MEQSEMATVVRHMAVAPVDVQAICTDLGIRFDKAWMDEASGSLSRNGNNFAITVNALESETRQRFTAAHELGHYLLHRDLMGDGSRMHRHIDTLYAGGEQSGDVIFNRAHEVEANRIAAQILMPKGLVEKESKVTQDVGELAQKFGVSRAAMEIRLKTLGLVK